MDSRRNLKQVYKVLVNKALDQSKSELAATVQAMGSFCQLVTDRATYEKLAAEADAIKKNDAPSFASTLLKHGQVGNSEAFKSQFKKFAELEDKQIKAATVFYAAKGLSNVWIYNKHLEYTPDPDAIKKVFNAKRLELALLNIKAELFPYDVDEIDNPHADFKDFYFHHQINDALQDYGKRTAELWYEKSVVKVGELQFMLAEAKKAVQATVSYQPVSEAKEKVGSLPPESPASAKSPVSANSSSLSFTFINNSPPPKQVDNAETNETLQLGK